MTTICRNCSNSGGRDHAACFRVWEKPWINLVTGKWEVKIGSCADMNMGDCEHFKPRWSYHLLRFLHMR